MTNNFQPENSTIKVLIVDDSPSDRSIFRRYLVQNNEQKFSFVEAESVGQAFEILSREMPHCILLDYDLPDGTGNELIEKLNEDHGKHNIPIVMLSGSGSIEIAVETMRLGAHDYLVKNRATAADLVRAIGNAIDKVRLYREKELATRAIQVSEERYRLLFDNTPLSALVFDRETLAILAVNDFAVKHYGYSREEFLQMTLDALDAFEGASKEVVVSEFCDNKGLIRNIPARHTKKDGTIIDVEINCHDIVFQNRDARFVIAQDITERTLAEREREENLIREQELREQAESANRSKDEFLAVISHELRSPLNAMSGWSKMLKRGMLDEEKKAQAIEVIDRNINLQNHLIEDLLDVSRIISGKLKIEPTEINFCRIVSEAVETARPLAAEKNIKLSLTTRAEICDGFGDLNRLYQIVGNLLTNAVKFTPDGGEINVNLKSVGNSVEISVSDSGIGIEPKLLPYIFERFRQADGSTRRKYGGLGLGLSIVKSLVEMHGGTITAESEGENRGSTFTVKIPLSAGLHEHDENPQKTIKDENEAAAGGILENTKIIIVDDETDALELLKFVLKNNGAEVYTFNSANDVLKMTAEINPDLLISDISMAEMDGYDLIHRIRESSFSKNKFLPAIAMTAYTSVEDRAQVLSAGFQMHISKPFDIEEVPHQVKSLLDSVKQ